MLRCRSAGKSMMLRANSDHVKPMFSFISEVMMVMGSSLGAAGKLTHRALDGWQLPRSYSMTNGIHSRSIARMGIIPSLHCFILATGLAKLLFPCLALWCRIATLLIIAVALSLSATHVSVLALMPSVIAATGLALRDGSVQSLSVGAKLSVRLHLSAVSTTLFQHHGAPCVADTGIVPQTRR
jgi:hypothetical protein